MPQHCLPCESVVLNTLTMLTQYVEEHAEDDYEKSTEKLSYKTSLGADFLHSHSVQGST